MNNKVKLTLMLVLGLGLGASVVEAKPAKKAAAASAKAKTKSVAKKPKQKPMTVKAAASQQQAVKKAPDANEKLQKISSDFKAGKIKHYQYWQKLEELKEAGLQNMTPANRNALNLIQANLLQQAGYPVLAAYYATATLKSASDPFDPALDGAWKTLAISSRISPIQYILEDLAGSIKDDSRAPTVMGSDWNYVKGNAAAASDRKKAIKYYEAVSSNDRHFLAAQYQLGMLQVEEGNKDEAVKAFNTVVIKSSLGGSGSLSATDRLEMWNYANMALGRYYYETKDFMKSVIHFRKVTKDSPLFYDSLFEQSWALFMSGNPMHALGSLHGAASPFFENKFNPEVKLLESMIYYWLCRYEDSRTALVEFAEDHAKQIDNLRDFLSRQRLNPDSAYRLFEDLVSGVSDDSLSVPRKVLQTAAERDSMLLVRDQLATVIGEDERLRYKGIFGSKQTLDSQTRILAATKNMLKRTLGEQFIVELKSIKNDFEDMNEQSQFLNLELLMSQKEHLMGGELHSSTKVTQVREQTNIAGWTKNKQSWADEKGEFWWDEIGYQIIAVKPQCNIQ
jgi:hypothetical protein